MTAGTPSMLQNCGANSAGSHGESFRSGLQKTVSWYLENRGLERADPERRVSVLDPGAVWGKTIREVCPPSQST